jgi:hypothetical protein
MGRVESTEFSVMTMRVCSCTGSRQDVTLSFLIHAIPILRIRYCMSSRQSAISVTATTSGASRERISTHISSVKIA